MDMLYVLARFRHKSLLFVLGPSCGAAQVKVRLPQQGCVLPGSQQAGQTALVLCMASPSVVFVPLCELQGSQSAAWYGHLVVCLVTR